MNRYSEILSVLLRYGFSDLVRKVDTDVYRRFRGGSGGRSARQLRRTMSRPERMRRAFEELGPAFVKTGQILSHRPDILPPDWISEFGKLRSMVPPIDAEAVRRIVEEELGRPPEEIFSEFNPVPIASASIAQVHRAKLMKPQGEQQGEPQNEPQNEPQEPASAKAPPASNGRSGPPPEESRPPLELEVAVKIQRPGIRRIIETDLSILRDIVRIAEKRIPALAAFRPLDVLVELERAMLSELDFRNEADNLDRFRRNFSRDETVTAPEPFRDYSGIRVLTMSYLDGVHVGDRDSLDSEKYDRRLIARRGADAVLSQVFEHRFFHSDPHGDNILILPDNRIAFLDFGQMGSILPSQRVFLADLLSALIHSDAVRAVRAVLNWSGYRSPEQTRRLTTDMEHIIERYLSRPFGRLQMGEMVSAMMELIRRYGIEIPRNFYLLSKALSTIEDIATSLYPDFDFIRASRPFAERMIKKELSPERIAEQIDGASGDTLRFIRDFPGETRDLINLLKSGRLKLEFELKDLARIDTTLKKVVTRLSAAIMLAAMIMASSILVQSLIPPLVFGVPVIGILGFLFSGILGFILLVDLWRSR
jgi:ubiquinone biosynthesis protein